MLVVGVVGVVGMDHYLWYNWDTDPTSSHSQHWTQSGSFDVIKKKGLNGVNTRNSARVSQSNYVWPRSSGPHMVAGISGQHQEEDCDGPVWSRPSQDYPRFYLGSVFLVFTRHRRQPLSGQTSHSTVLKQQGHSSPLLSGFWPSFLDRSSGGRRGGWWGYTTSPRL